MKREWRRAKSECRAAPRAPHASADALQARAFTLTEMLVSLFVIVIAITIVANVFRFTTETAATSAAIAEVEGVARAFLHEISEELGACDPSQSFLYIHGRTQVAARTEAERAAGWRLRTLTGDPALVPSGALDVRLDANSTTAAAPGTPLAQYSDPRADILAFFTQRPLASRAPGSATPSALSANPFQLSLQRGAKVAPSLVTYGHAAFAKVSGDQAAGYSWGTPTHIETFAPYANGAALSPIPSAQWHLARRQVLIEDTSISQSNISTPVALLGTGTGSASTDDFTRILRCFSEDALLAGDAVSFRLRDYMKLLSAAAPPAWRVPASLTGVPAPGWSPYTGVGNGSLPTEFLLNLVNGLIYPAGDPTNHWIATVVNQTPQGVQNNLGVQLLPGCAWFQVEILMPEDPRNGRAHPDGRQRDDTPRWVSVEPGRTYVFAPDSAENRAYVQSQVTSTTPIRATGRHAMFKPQWDPTNGAGDLNIAGGGVDDIMITPVGGAPIVNPRPVRLWPYAIRVTVRIYDVKGRLNEPLTRSIVHRFD